MRLLKLLCASILMIYCLLGCDEAKVSRQLRDFSKVEIIFPSCLTLIKGREVASVNIPSGKPMMVFYYDTLACGACRVNHLRDYVPIYRLADSLGTFDVVTVFSPQADESNDILRQLIDYQFEYPVYLDFYGEFAHNNSDIPSDRRFHSFLLDAQRHPILVGDPISGERMWALFEETVRGF